MGPRASRLASTFAALLLAAIPPASAQDGPPARPATRPANRPEGPGFFGGPGMRQDRKIVDQFDKDDNGWLNAEERKAARESVRSTGGGPRRGGGFRGGNRPVPTAGPRIKPEDVQAFPNAHLYEPTVLRTLFFEFENDDWEAEMTDFHRTDVEVPATLIVDGKKYPNVGVSFRGASSYMTAAAPGYKKSLNVSIDLADKDQRLYGYKTLNLLNSNGDPSMLRAALYSHIARQYIPAPRVNLVRVVINGESWGVFANAQQFNKDFLKEFKDRLGGSSKGIRWKVPGSPNGRGSLAYLGDDPASYKGIYEIKTDDPREADRGWQALINVCRVLHETPTGQLEEKLSPILDIDGVLWFLALENALANSDGYWVRASDYHLFLDESGRFHIIPHDMNETFAPGGGPGMGGRFRRGPGGPGGPPGGPPGADGPRRGNAPDREPRPDGPRADDRPGPDGPLPRGGPDLRDRPQGPPPRGADGQMRPTPLEGIEPPNLQRPLLGKLLSAPALRQRYLQHLRTIAEKDLDWEKLGPVVRQYRQLIEKEVEADTRKLDTYEAFLRAVDDTPTAPDAQPQGRGRMSLRQFAELRRKQILEHPAIKALPAQ